MSNQAHAEEHAGRIHTLHKASWPKGDHRKEWKWKAYIDGIYWRLFKTVGDWRNAIRDYAPSHQRGPFADATDQAVFWSEHEGRMLARKLWGE